jgi:hypothetical protein
LGQVSSLQRVKNTPIKNYESCQRNQTKRKHPRDDDRSNPSGVESTATPSSPKPSSPKEKGRGVISPKQIEGGTLRNVVNTFSQKQLNLIQEFFKSNHANCFWSWNPHMTTKWGNKP